MLSPNEIRSPKFSVVISDSGILRCPLLAVYVLAFPALGGSWAYRSVESDGCHFVIGPIGYALLVMPVFVFGRVAWKSLGKRRHHA